MLQLGNKPTVKQISEITGVKVNTLYTRSQRPDQEFTLEELLKIEQALNVELVNKSFKMDNIKLVVPEVIDEADRAGKSFKIPYWNGISSDLIKKYGVDDICIDLQTIYNEWKANPEDLIFIAMPGDDMDGGDFPIRNKDLLIVDTSRNNISDTGIFFCTSHGQSNVYVRRIIQKMSTTIKCITTIDNLRYKSMIEKYWTEEKWKEADVQIVGRVIKNMSYTI